MAIRIAELWQAGKMIGGDEDEVRNALLEEVHRLRKILDLPPVAVSVDFNVDGLLHSGEPK